MEEKRAQERARQDQDGEQVKDFKEAVAAHNRALLTEPRFISSGSTANSPVISPAPTPVKKDAPPPKVAPKSGFGKKDQKTLLKGVIRKKGGAFSSSNEKDKGSTLGDAEPAKAGTPTLTKKRTAGYANHDSQRPKDGQDTFTSEKRQRTDNQIGGST